MRAIVMLLAAGCLLLLAPLAEAGEIVEARCGCKSAPDGRPVDCAWSATLFLGGGMRNHQTVSWFPAYCAANKSLVRQNRKQPGQTVPPCPGPVVPYSDPSLVRLPGQDGPPPSKYVPLSFGDKVSYYCPATGRFDLHFHLIALWD